MSKSIPFLTRSKVDANLQKQLKDVNDTFEVVGFAKNIVTNSLLIRSINSATRSLKVWLVVLPSHTINHIKIVPLTRFTKAPAAVGAFYYFNSLTNPINQPPIPGTIANKTVIAFTHPAT